MRCGGRRWNTWRPALEERPRRATTTRHARDFLSRAASQALRRNLAARHDRACPGGRSPTTARARARRPPAHPRVKGTRLLGAGERTRKKGRISVAAGGDACAVRWWRHVCRWFVAGGLLFVFVGPAKRFVDAKLVITKCMPLHVFFRHVVVCH